MLFWRINFPYNTGRDKKSFNRRAPIRWTDKVNFLTVCFRSFFMLLYFVFKKCWSFKVQTIAEKFKKDWAKLLKMIIIKSRCLCSFATQWCQPIKVILPPFLSWCSILTCALVNPWIWPLISLIIHQQKIDCENICRDKSKHHLVC